MTAKRTRTSTIRKSPVEVLRGGLQHFRKSRADMKQLEKAISNSQQELVLAMEEVDPNNNGIVVEPSDSKGTAYVQRNDGSLVWNEEKIIDWLSKPVKGRRTLLRKSQSLVFDINKFEALVASGEVPPKIAQRFQDKTDPPKPFIRFGPKGDNSL